MIPPRAVVETLRRAQAVAVVCHEDPDPDGVGSLLALGLGLERLGRRVACVVPDLPGPGLRFLPGFEQLVRPDQVEGRYPVVAVVDTDPGRVGEAHSLLEQAEAVVNIDHHQTNPGGGSLSWVVPEAAACGLLVEALLRALGVGLDPAIATCLFAAVAGDTGWFQFSNTTAPVLEAAARLAAAGAEPGRIARALFGARPVGYLRLLREVLGTLGLAAEGRVAWVTLEKAAREAHGLSRAESDGFIQYPRMVEGVEVAVLFREEPGRVKVSFRSNQQVDVAELARQFGGGGHPRAAGCWVEGELAAVRDRVLAAVSEAVRRAGP